MSSNKPPKMLSKDMTNPEFFEEIKNGFDQGTPIAIFVKYEEARRSQKATSVHLRQLNRYHNINTALLVNGNYDDVDDEGKKLPVLDNRKKKIRYRDGSSKYEKDMNGEMINLVKKWYGKDPVIILVFCADRECSRFGQLSSLRHRTKVTTISCYNDTNDNSTIAEVIEETVEWLLELARKRR